MGLQAPFALTLTLPLPLTLTFGIMLLKFEHHAHL